MPGLQQGGLTTGYITPDSVYDERDIYRKVFNRHDEATLFDYLWYSNRKEVMHTSKPYHFEDDFLISDAEVGAKDASTGAGVAVVVTIAAASHSDGGKRSPFIVKATGIAYTATGQLEFYVTAKDTTTDNAHTVTLQPPAGVDLGTALAVGNIISPVSYAAADGAKEADSEIRLPLVFNNMHQIIKTNVTMDGSMSADMVTYEAPDGQQYQYYKSAVDQDVNHRIKMGYAILFQRGTSYTDPEENKAAPTMYGLEYWTDTYGFTKSYTGNVALTDIEDIQKYWDTQRAAVEHLLLAGGTLNIDLDNLFKGTFDQGALDYAVSQWGNTNPNMRHIDYQTDGVFMNNRILHKKKFDPFTYKPVTGATTSKYPTMALTVPLKKVRNRAPNPDAAGSGGADTIDTIMLRYKAWDMENRYNKHFVRPEEITGDDKWRINNKSDISMLFAVGNEYVKLTT